MSQKVFPPLPYTHQCQTKALTDNWTSLLAFTNTKSQQDCLNEGTEGNKMLAWTKLWVNIVLLSFHAAFLLFHSWLPASQYQPLKALQYSAVLHTTGTVSLLAQHWELAVPGVVLLGGVNYWEREEERGRASVLITRHLHSKYTKDFLSNTSIWPQAHVSEWGQRKQSCIHTAHIFSLPAQQGFYQRSQVWSNFASLTEVNITVQCLQGAAIKCRQHCEETTGKNSFWQN